MRNNEEIIDISEAENGDIIRYHTSEKLYLVSHVVKPGAAGNGSRFLVSKTQWYDSSIKYKFQMVLVMRKEGAAQYNTLVSEHYKSPKNFLTFKEFKIHQQERIDERTEKHQKLDKRRESIATEKKPQSWR